MGGHKKLSGVAPEFGARVHDGLAELKRLDPTFIGFGASRHRYELGSRVTASQVAAIENRYGFRFPDDYRAFVMALGAGGAGPSYGVLGFGLIDNGVGFTQWARWKLKPGDSFPHTSKWNDVDMFYRGMPIRAAYKSASAHQDAVDEWYENGPGRAAERAYYDALGTSYGCIPICHHGCALRDWLVVSGPEAGNVWRDDSADRLGIAPIENGNRRRTTFSQWYLDWLDLSAARLAN